MEAHPSTSLFLEEHGGGAGEELIAKQELVIRGSMKDLSLICIFDRPLSFALPGLFNITTPLR
jgi:hypothetical protein